MNNNNSRCGYDINAEIEFAFKGDTGDTGNGISSVKLNDDYTLTLILTDGTSYTTTSIRGEKGDTGERGERGLQGIQGERGERGLQGVQGIQGERGLQGERGEKGDTGATGASGERGAIGATGNGIASVVLNSDYTLTINMTDGTSYTTTSIRGEKGDTGVMSPEQIAKLDGLDEKVEELKLFKFPNTNIIGEPLIENGNISRFSASDYLIFPFVVDVRNNPFVVTMCFTTGADVTTQQNILDSYFGMALAIQNGKGTMALSSNGTSWNIGVATGTAMLQPNKTYYAKITWDGMAYRTALSTDGVNYTDDMLISSSVGLHPTTMYIGASPNIFGAGTAHPFGGTINMNKCSLSVAGLEVWQGMDDAGLSTRADLSLSNLDAEGEKRFAEKANAADVIELGETVRRHSHDISVLQFDVAELKKEMEITEYDQLAQHLLAGTLEEHVNMGDELMVNVITGLTITSTNRSLTFTVQDEYEFAKQVGRIDDDQYVFEYKNGHWTYLERPVNISDFGFTVNGTPAETDILYVTMAYRQDSYTFVDYDPTGSNAIHPVNDRVHHFAVLEQTYTPNTQAFDQQESVICVTVGNTLPAGKYYVYNVAGATGDYWCNNKRQYYLFEILHDLVATEATGDIQLRYSSIGARETTGDARGVYQLYTKPYKCIDDAVYNSDTISFIGQLTAPSSEYVDIRTVAGFTTDQSMESEGIVYNNIGHAVYGSNEYIVSNVRQRLNSTEKAMHPVRLHRNDVVTGMKNQKGFSWGLDPRFVALIQPCAVAVRHALNDEYTKDALYTVEDFCTLLSMKEMSFNLNVDEGVVTKLYNTYTGGVLDNNAVASRAKKIARTDSAPSSHRWSRSANTGGSRLSRLVSPTGAFDYYDAYGGNRVAPSYIIGVAEPS